MTTRDGMDAQADVDADAEADLEAGQRPEDEPGSGVVVAFGRQLKLLRVRAGLDRSDDVLDAGGVLKALKEEVARAQYPAFFRDAARLEAKAAALNVYAMYAVPGLTTPRLVGRSR